MTTTEPPTRRPRRSQEPTPAQALREAITPYIALPRLRRLVAEHGDLAQALRCPTPPQDVLAVLELLRAMLQPNPRDQIKSPTDAAGLLMLEMSHLDQEHLRTVLLDTKNRVQAITTVYIGSVNTAMIRVGEIFKEAFKLEQRGADRRPQPPLRRPHAQPRGCADDAPDRRGRQAARHRRARSSGDWAGALLQYA